ncbi:MAG: HPF/RaiA family ribosome-associated protein [Anaerolineae bacterium]|nr:HPF/RaiA family ribosome-associated protein [Anaerolineae bacterium]
MSRTDFHFEFHSQVPYLAAELMAETESRLRELAEDHTDMVGAAAAVEELSRDQTPHCYRARIVVYIRPENIAAEEQGESLEGTLKEVLEAIERQVRQRREKLDKQWERRDKVVQERSIRELTPRELFASYADQLNPAALLDWDRATLAAELMTSKGLDQEAAYYAADQILAFIQEADEPRS